MTPEQRPVPAPPPHLGTGGGSAGDSAGESGAGVPGDSAVRRAELAVASLTGLDAIPVAERVARFDAVHAALTEALASIDKV